MRWVCDKAKAPLILGPGGLQYKMVMRQVCDGQLAPWSCDLASGPPISAFGSCYNSTTRLRQSFRHHESSDDLLNGSTKILGYALGMRQGHYITLLGPGGLQSKTVMRQVCDGQLSIP